MTDKAKSNRKTIRQRIMECFSENLGTEYKSSYLHGVLGSAFRTRVSEINRLNWRTTSLSFFVTLTGLWPMLSIGASMCRGKRRTGSRSLR